MAEFTGERVTPGEVEPDLWNEHMARYAFVARLARGRRVLDAGCGTGYGAAALALSAAQIVGIDSSRDAIEYAQRHYPLANLWLLRGSCTALPLAAGSFDLVVAFEVIEHLGEWRQFLAESRRVLAPNGLCVISTPNKRYYSESRGDSGSNPYHEHEFEFEEFRDELGRVFPHVSILLQNHAAGIVFQPVKTFTSADAHVEKSEGGNPEDSHFFVAVCSLAPQPEPNTFVYVPRAANVLREREQHIARLGQQLAELSADHQRLLDLFRKQNDELEERNRWAAQLNRRIEEAGATIRKLQQELEAMSRGYEGKIKGLEEEMRQTSDWALKTSKELQDKCNELAQCVEALHQTERTVEERTQWALNLDAQVRSLEAEVGRFQASRWVRLGRALRLGPEAQNQ